jgi:hypothetical protein
MNPPDCSQFVETTPELINPENPKSGTFRQIVLDDDGKPKLDSKACAEAMRVYKKIQALWNGGGTANKSNDPKPLAGQLMRAFQLVKNNPPKTLSEAIGDLSGDQVQPCPTDPRNVNSLRQQYCFARNLVVQYFNFEAPSQKASQKSSTAQIQSGQKRAPAAAPAGAGREDYVLKAEKAAKDAAEKDGKDSDHAGSGGSKEVTESLYMDPSDIDKAIRDQYPQ